MRYSLTNVILAALVLVVAFLSCSVLNLNGVRLQSPVVVATEEPNPSNLDEKAAASELPAGDQLMEVCGYTTADAKKATGVDVQRISTEACGFVWRAVPKATVSATCPINMVCTFDLGNKVVVVKGDGKQYPIVAGTFRMVSAYPLDDAVRDVCRLLAKEKVNGQNEVPSFAVEAANFTCK